MPVTDGPNLPDERSPGGRAPQDADAGTGAQPPAPPPPLARLRSLKASSAVASDSAGAQCRKPRPIWHGGCGGSEALPSRAESSGRQGCELRRLWRLKDCHRLRPKRSRPAQRSRVARMRSKEWSTPPSLTVPTGSCAASSSRPNPFELTGRASLALRGQSSGRSVSSARPQSPVRQRRSTGLGPGCRLQTPR
jgi:hypothetical protein